MGGEIEIIEHGSLTFDEDIDGDGYYMIYRRSR